MIDPFFFDRLMHAFTTANSTPLSQAAEHAANSLRPAHSSGEVSTCRVLREAEAVVAEVLGRERVTQAGTTQPADDIQGG